MLFRALSAALLGPTVDTWATGGQRTRRHEHQDYLERYPNGYTCHFVRPDWVLPRRTKAAAG